MTTLAGLAIRLRATAAALPVAANAAKKAVATAVIEDLVQSSPADTGAFISNWQAGATVGPEIASYQLGVKGSSREAVAAAALSTAAANIDEALPGEPILVFNATDYGKYLNDGTSTHPALGFVERALIVGNEVLRTLGLKLG